MSIAESSDPGHAHGGHARRLDPHALSFTLLLGSLVTLASFATDMGLPVLAATVGVAIAGAFGGWRAIYAALAIGGTVLVTIVALLLDESRRQRVAHTFGTAIRSYVSVLSHPVTFGYIAVIALNFGCLF